MSLERQDIWNEAVTSFQRVWRASKSMLQDEGGVTAIEYALLASLIAIAAIGSISLLGGGVDGMWTKIATAVSDAVAGVP